MFGRVVLASFVVVTAGCAPAFPPTPPQQCADTNLEPCIEVCDASLPVDTATTTSTACVSGQCACGFTDVESSTCYAFFRTTPKVIACPTTEDVVERFADNEFSNDEDNVAHEGR